MSTGGITVIFCNACGAHNAPDTRFCQSCGQAMAAIEPLPVTASVAAYAAHPYGGFWIRVLAAIIDVIVVEIVVAPLSVVMGRSLGFGMLWGMALAVLAAWLYEALLTSSSKQATVGKIVVNLRVTDLDGRRISFGRATARVFAKYLSAMVLCIGFLMVAFTEKKQGLHDMLAGTLVQKKR